MGYWRNCSSPYEVQARTRKKDFNAIKEHYDSIIPIRGKNKALNIRPNGDRRKQWERVFKVNDNEYYVSNNAGHWRSHHDRAITWRLNGDIETVTVHTPRKHWLQHANDELNPRALSASSTFWFYHFNMPRGMFMINYNANKFVGINTPEGVKSYTITSGDISFTKKQGETYWKPLSVRRMFKHTIDRKLKKQCLNEVNPFMEYFNIMSPLLDKTESYYGDVFADLNKDIFKKGEPTDEWAILTERIVNNYRYRPHYNNKLLDIKTKLQSDYVRLVKPFKVHEIPLGELANDRYKNFFR